MYRAPEQKLKIVVQPEESFRFRENSDTSNGAIKGRDGNGYPAVELLNYDHKTLVCVSLVQNDGQKGVHPYEISNNYEYTNENNIAEFSKLSIIKVKKSRLKHLRIEEELLRTLDIVTPITKRDGKLYDANGKVIMNKKGEIIKGKKLKELNDEAQKGLDEIDLSKCQLCFQAMYEYDSHYIPFTNPVFSECIIDNKSKVQQEKPLTIIKLNKLCSHAKGGKEIWMEVDGLTSDANVFTCFKEVVKGDTVWEEDVCVNKTDIYGNAIIIIKTPPYKNESILQPVDVFIQLKCPDKVSEPRPFKYKPNKVDDQGVSHKRKKSIPAEALSFDYPVTKRIKVCHLSDSTLEETFSNAITTEAGPSGYLKNTSIQDCTTGIPQTNLHYNQVSSTTTSQNCMFGAPPGSLPSQDIQITAEPAIEILAEENQYSPGGATSVMWPQDTVIDQSNSFIEISQMNENNDDSGPLDSSLSCYFADHCPDIPCVTN